MTALCTAAKCDQPTDAYLCSEHTRRLEAVLGELPGYLADLDVTRARADRIAPAGNRSLRSVKTSTETACWCGCTTADPYHHISHHGHLHETVTSTSDKRYARPDLGSAGALPIATQASDVRTRAENTLTTWCRHLVESRGMNVDLGPQPLGPTHPDCKHPTCVLIRDHADVLPRLARWLLARVDSIRLDEGAGELLWDLDDLRRRIRHVVDRPADRVYAGPCECGLDLYAPWQFLALQPKPDVDPVIVCDGWNRRPDDGEPCGRTHRRTERRSFLLDALEDHAAPMSELLPVLCQLLPAPVPPRGVTSSWVTRGNVRITGKTAENVKLVAASDLASMLRRYRPTPQRAREKMAS